MSPLLEQGRTVFLKRKSAYCQSGVQNGKGQDQKEVFSVHEKLLSVDKSEQGKSFGKSIVNGMTLRALSAAALNSGDTSATLATPRNKKFRRSVWKIVFKGKIVEIGNSKAEYCHDSKGWSTDTTNPITPVLHDSMTP